jgi:hypothetical protein
MARLVPGCATARSDRVIALTAHGARPSMPVPVSRARAVAAVAVVVVVVAVAGQ